MTLLEPLLKLGADTQAVCVDVEVCRWASKSPLCLAADADGYQAVSLLLQC